MMIRALLAVLAACLLPAPAARAESVTVRAVWDDLRMTVDHGEFLPEVTVRTGPSRSGQFKGKLVDVSDSGITLEQRRGSRFIKRADVRSVRLVPAKGYRRGWRNVAKIVALPVGFASFFGGCLLLGGCGEAPWNAGEIATTFGMGVGVPYVIYQLARRADRRAAAVVVVLDTEKEQFQQ
jgi:hypothetical protein